MQLIAQPVDVHVRDATVLTLLEHLGVHLLQPLGCTGQDGLMRGRCADVGYWNVDVKDRLCLVDLDEEICGVLVLHVRVDLYDDLVRSLRRILLGGQEHACRQPVLPIDYEAFLLRVLRILDLRDRYRSRPAFHAALHLAVCNALSPMLPKGSLLLPYLGLCQQGHRVSAVNLLVAEIDHELAIDLMFFASQDVSGSLQQLRV
mmetsp:Transcript_6712/g.23625  ORF Transcript_6712/g.23625 Transcript_6712/m.23625 type:complete len:203 (-) Transcript_6712:299-907(-)